MLRQAQHIASLGRIPRRGSGLTCRNIGTGPSIGQHGEPVEPSGQAIRKAQDVQVRAD
jgi:hypothetical protein